MDFENNDNWQNDKNIDSELVLILFSDCVSFYLNLFILFSLVYNMTVIIQFFFGNVYFNFNLNDNLFDFIQNVENKLSKKLLKYNGLFSDSSDSLVDFPSDSSSEKDCWVSVKSSSSRSS